MNAILTMPFRVPKATEASLAWGTTSFRKFRIPTFLEAIHNSCSLWAHGLYTSLGWVQSLCFG